MREVPAPIFRGLYPIIDTAACARRGVRPAALARAIAAAGVRVAQFRHKGPYTREVFAEAERVAGILRAAGARLVVNDRADVALMLRADGVHLGQQDLPPAAVRAVVGSSVWIGYSTHNREQLEKAARESADYLAIGPVFTTGSKENPDPVLGLGPLAEWRALTSRPLVAIGGITTLNAAAVLAAGVDAVAVISDLLGDDLEERVKEWQRLVQQSSGAA